MSIQPISGGPFSLPATALSQAPQANSPRGRESPGQTEAETPTRETSGITNEVPQADVRNLPRQEMHSLVEDAVKRANETVQVLRSNLQFTVDETTGIDVVKFIDIKTKEVIRQIPNEEMLALARRLDEIKGLLIKEKA